MAVDLEGLKRSLYPPLKDGEDDPWKKIRDNPEAVWALEQELMQPAPPHIFDPEYDKPYPTGDANVTD
jgi:hypothetical protein